MSDITLYEMTASPNNLKIRIALAYKGLEYERVPFEFVEFPGDRSGVVEISGQPRLPVLKDGATIVFDSGAILRHLEANYPDTRSLFSADYATLGEIEQWELFARTRISEPLGMLFGQALVPEPDAQVIAAANALLNERTGELEEKLNAAEFLVGDHLTAADIACASPLYLADLSEQNASSHPISSFFHKHMHLGDGREKTRAWIRRVIAWDPVLGRSGTTV